MAQTCRLSSFKVESKNNLNEDEKISAFSALCVFISFVLILADLTTDILVFAEYCKRNLLYWAIATIILIIIPNVLVNIFSMRWIVNDEKSSSMQWIIHCTLLGVTTRYIFFLHKVFWCQNISETSKVHKLLTKKNDLNLLHFLYTFTGTIPQILLQIYTIVELQAGHSTRVFSVTTSTLSVLWACVTYTCATKSDNSYYYLSTISKLIWHCSMLIVRISSILLFSIIFGIWTLVPLGMHWAAMTFWIVTQKTTFCPNKLEETLYNVVMGFVYCFSYINLREGHTRYRLLMFYTFMLTQNFGSLFLYIVITPLESQKKAWSLVATVSIVAGTFIGICSMIIYYRWLHENGPIPWKCRNADLELNNKTTAQSQSPDKSASVRSFKTKSKNKIYDDSLRKGSIKTESTTQVDVEATDKKFLLDHWIARSGSPTFLSSPIDTTNDTSGIEFHTVENTPQPTNFGYVEMTAPKLNPKPKTFCSPTELALRLNSIENIEGSIDEITTSNLNLQKRRAICSSDELQEDLHNLDKLDSQPKLDQGSEMSHETDGSNKKTSSDSIDMDLDLSFSDINSSDINMFNENIVQKLCLSALKNIKVGNRDADIENIQRIALDILKEMYAKKGKNKNKTDLFSTKRDLDTPTELLSVHDYENICAVNIAREAWGLRSWNGYCDIENWLHDGSVVQDRRRDTLTSGSSEISSCISQELKNSIMATSPFLVKKAPTYSNVFIKNEKNQDDYVNSNICHLGIDEMFLAKPCLVDNKDTSQLEPILEELDDLGDVDAPNKTCLNSESSLVATIDEIRKATITNSPRNVFHRREHIWDSPQLETSVTIESNLKQALWKEPSKFHSSNIMKSIPEKENILNAVNVTKFDAHRKELNVSIAPSEIFVSTLDFNKNTKRRHKSNNIKSQMKKVNNTIENCENIYIRQSSDNNSLPISSEDLSTNHVTSSLQSLILNDNSQTHIINGTSVCKSSILKKPSRSKPRRKFSILREKFEPKINKDSDEEMLYQYNEHMNFRQHDSQGPIINKKNKLNRTVASEYHTKTTKPTASTSCASEYALSKNIKEKRSQFMKQVLSPPKFNTKLRHKV